MLFFVHKDTPLIVAKNISEESFDREVLRKTQANTDMVFNEDSLVIDPFALKKGTINKFTDTNIYLSELIANGYYGFKSIKTGHVFLIHCENIKIF